jgi:hypothetical protein
MHTTGGTVVDAKMDRGDWEGERWGGEEKKKRRGKRVGGKKTEAGGVAMHSGNTGRIITMTVFIYSILLLYFLLVIACYIIRSFIYYALFNCSVLMVLLYFSV